MLKPTTRLSKRRLSVAPSNQYNATKSAIKRQITKSSIASLTKRDQNPYVSKVTKKLERRGTIYKGSLNPNVTKTNPFQFSKANPKSKGELSKNSGICHKLLCDIRDLDSKAKVRFVSFKILLKTIFGIYYDKSTNSKDSKVIENQTLIEYLYDNLFHKYGIAALTEKNVKEILITVKYHDTLPKIKLIAKFLWLTTDRNYTVDDLKFYFYIHKVFVLEDVFETLITTTRKDFNFEGERYNAHILIHKVVPTIFDDPDIKAELENLL